MAATGRSAGAALRIRSPSTVCWRTKLHSSESSGPGLVRMASGMPTLPTSCSAAARASSSICSPARPSRAADREREPRDPVGARRQIRLVGADDLDEDVVGLLSRAGVAALLARIHPLVGELQRIVDRARLVGEENSSARRRHRERLAALLEGVHGSRHRGLQAVAHRGHQHAELVAAESICATDGRDRRLQLVPERARSASPAI